MANCSIIIQSNNVSCKSNSFLEIAYMFLAPLTLIVNLLLITAMTCTKQALSNASNTLIMCMSFVDAVAGAVCLPLMSIMFSDYHFASPLLVATMVASSFLSWMSTLIMILMAIDRYLHMETSLSKLNSTLRKLFKGKRILLPLAICVVCSVASSIVSIKIYSFSNTGIIITLLLASVLNLVFIPGIAAIYIRGYRRVRKFVRHNPVYSRPNCIDQKKFEMDNRGSKTAENQPAYIRSLQKTVFMLVVTLVVTYTPFVVAVFSLPIVYMTGKQTKAMVTFFDFATLVYSMNFTINSLVVFKMNKRARFWLYKKLRLNKCWLVNHSSHEPPKFSTRAKSIV